MARAARPTAGLAQRIVRTAFVVGVCTITAALVFSLISASRLTAETERNRDLRVIEVVDDSVAGDLRSASLAVSQASEQAASQRGPKLEDALGIAFKHNQATLDSLIIADRTGRTVAAFPRSEIETASVRQLPAFVAALAGRTGFTAVWPSTGGCDVWMTHTAIGRGGEALVICVKLKDRIFSDAVNAAGEPTHGRAVIIYGRDTVVAANEAQNPLLIKNARWSPETADAGRLRARARDGTPLVGRYRDVRFLESLGWRIVVVQPATASWGAMARSVAPTAVVLVMGGLAALGSVWVISQRMVRPLRDLERAARNAAAGSYVRPLSTDSGDELSRVADAFNAVSRRLNALQDLSQLLASSSRLDEVLDAVLDSMNHLVGPRGTAIYLLDDNAFVPRRARGKEFAHAEPVSSHESGWLNGALATREAVCIQGEADIARELPGVQPGQLDALAAPLLAGDTQLGAIVVLREADSSLSEGEQEMLRTFCAHAAVAVQTSRLFEFESEARRIAEALQLIAEKLVRPDSIQAALHTVEDIVADLFDAAVVSIAPLDRAVLGMDSTEDRRDARLIGLAYRAFGLRGRPCAVIIGRDEEGAEEVLDEYRADRLLAVPIAFETDHGAVLLVGLRSGVPIRHASEIGEAIADEISLALDNAYFFRRALARAENLETIFRISQAVGSSLRLDVVLDRVLDVVQKILSADAVALMLNEPDGRHLAVAMGRGALPGRILDLRLEIGQDIPGQVSKRREPVALRDLHDSMGGVAGMAALAGLRSLLAVPLLARGRAIGVLIVFANNPGAFSTEDMNVLQTFASQAALAIDTARLYGREHEVSRVLQESILPERNPDLAELEAGSVYQPGSAEATIGGDYYDLFRGPGGSIWFSIADVCGKGVRAATKTSMIKYVIRALVVAGHSPSKIVSEVNNMIAEHDDPSDIVTVWLGCFVPSTGVLSWADGGHPPGLLRRIDGSIEPLSVTGPLLGAQSDLSYDEGSTTLRAGDTILLYTDGVTEARRGSIFYGEERVRDVLAGDEAPPDMAESLLKSVCDYAAGELRDDVAVLVLRVR